MSTPKLQPQGYQQRYRSLLKSEYLTKNNVYDDLALQAHQFMHHPSLLAISLRTYLEKPQIHKHQLLKWIAVATFIHPVLISQSQKAIQQIIGHNPLFKIKEWETPKIILEAINIFCLVKGFNLEIFLTDQSPKFQNNYERALMINFLQHVGVISSEQVESIDMDTIIEVKKFFNGLHQMKRHIQNQIKDVIENQELGMSLQQQEVIHHLDIEIASWNGITIAQYLPANYKGQYIELWMDRTVQLNSLLGNFICKQKFGQFEYVKGPLTYAIEKGILLVLNNLQQISNQLLVNIQTLARQMKVYHNQKQIKAGGGFRILGLCNFHQLSPKSKARLLHNQYIKPLTQEQRLINSSIPFICNETNKQYLIETLSNHQKKYGYISAHKLWGRIVRTRQGFVESAKQLWETYFTQSFKSEVNLQIQDLADFSNNTRTISYEENFREVKIGRVVIDTSKAQKVTQKIVKTQYSLAILQKLGICMQLGETPLLISETGCGKTTLVQFLAQVHGHQLYVYNMSSGTDAIDLVGGFKPIDCRMLLKQLFYRFIQKFQMISGSEKHQNKVYLKNLNDMYQSNKLKALLNSLIASIPKIKLKVDHPTEVKEWDQLYLRLSNIRSNLDKIDSNLIFSFIEGNLIKAIKNGDWVLIDEINLASNDVLQKVVPLVENKSLLLYQKGDLTYIERHPDFRIIGCMNPANDAGKKPLPSNLQQKFTVITLQQPTKFDIEMMIQEICPQLNPSEISKIYFQVKKQKTVSLRNLSRCLAYLNRNKEIYTYKRALYDALILGFQSKKLLKGYVDSTVPKNVPNFTHIQGFLIETGNFIHEGESEVFHLTDTFQEHLKDFLRAIAGTQLPVLLEGPTSAGKTSIIRYVASIAGFKCIRINNHQHTQIQEYLGNYFPNKQGKLVFREGPLVQAVKEGYWLILDELNLARTQILQCLNRLLDDNRELFIPEQQKHIKPHKNFRIFATQNPSSYSGRKTLSRAFRNRFISLNFEDITIHDTMEIMKVRRSILANSKQLFVYVKKVLETLQNYRSKQRVFSKDGIITIRDLLKWTGRKFIDKQSFMKDGYALLAQKLRTEAYEQKKYVSSVLFAGMKAKDIDMTSQYERVIENQLPNHLLEKSNIYVQMNSSFKRMVALTFKAIRNDEPVLLVGETGCGKTTLAELIASISGRQFYSINCHKHTEASDLLGSLRPCIRPDSINKFEYVNGVVINAMLNGAVLLIDEINTAQDSVLQRLNQLLESNQIGVERGEGWETIKAKTGFCIIATMNPSGDYGKKQLSPALRNRFTEIWVQPITHPEYLISAKNDIMDMIVHKLQNSPDEQVSTNHQIISEQLFMFLQQYNCVLGPKNGLVKKLLTMRDINWVCRFINQAQIEGWQHKYYWALHILAIEGVNFMMGDDNASFKLQTMKKQLKQCINKQLASISQSSFSVEEKSQLEVIQIIKKLNFPILIKTDLPLQLLDIYPKERIFFSAHTELTDLLGQFHPESQNFVWHDQLLLESVKNGATIALYDINLAQQQVIEGINSLFDYRGSLFIIELNKTFHKHDNFRSIIVLKENNLTHDRKGLPNSFLNRFIKIRISDVSKQRKLSYLKSKYPNLTNNFMNILSVMVDLVKLEILEFACQMSLNGELKKALEILGITQEQLQQRVLGNSQQQLANCLHQQSQSDYNLQQEHIMRLLPLSEFDRPNIKSLVNSFTILNSSVFSVCLIGNMQERDAIANSLGYLMHRKMVKVILSTMTDMAELLGSYEQLQIDNDIQQSQGGAIFQYVKSRIIKTVENSEHEILYVEVPNESLLERLQKGIKSLYQQKTQIIVGINQLTESSNPCNPNFYIIRSNTKFIPIQINSSVQIYKGKHQRDPFIPNYSLIKNYDSLIRIQELSEFIKTNAQKSFDRNETRSWSKISELLCNRDLKASFMKQKLGYNTEEYNRVWNTSLRKRGDNELEALYNRQNKGIELTSSQEEYEKYLIEYYEQINLKMRLPKNEKQQVLFYNLMLLMQPTHQNIVYNSIIGQKQISQSSTELKQITKFQIIYLSGDDSLYREQSAKLISILYNTPENYSLFQRFLKETQSVFDKLRSQSYSEILIQFNQEQYKIVPILNNRFSKYYYILSNREVFGTFNQVLVGKLLSFERVIGKANHIENDVIEYLEYLKIDIKKCGEWLAKMQIRDLQLYSMLENNLSSLIQSSRKYVTNIASTFTHNEILSKLIKFANQNEQQIQEEYKSEEYAECQKIQKLGKLIFKAFKPFSISDGLKSSPLNLMPHIKTQLHLQTLQELSIECDFYQSVYEKVITTKYGGYKPESYKHIYKNKEFYSDEISKIKQKYIYRGYDNIRLLKDFYEKLCMVCWKIENSQFSIQATKDLLVQLYENYYQNYRDILWPLLSGLILIFNAKQTMQNIQKTHGNKVPLTLSLIPNNNPFIEALNLILQKQDEQFIDNAKDYQKFQRKFNKQVIINEYSQQGVEKNKANNEAEFRQLFGKELNDNADAEKDKKNMLDQLYYLLRKQQVKQYQQLLKKHIFSSSQTCQQLGIGMQLLYGYDKNRKNISIINIYEETSTQLIEELTAPINSIMLQIKVLFKKYSIDSIKMLGILCNKIQEHRATQQVYKILGDCQYLTDKIFQINAILPSKQRIDTQEIVKQCLRMRRIELKNWKSMLSFKVKRIEKSDILEFIQFYRKLKTIVDMKSEFEEKEEKICFQMCDQFLSNSKLSCYNFRLHILSLLSNYIPQLNLKPHINRVIKFYTYLKDAISEQWDAIKKEKMKEVEEYEKLTSWNSNEYLIFKATCEKFQRKIHHILKRYEEELSMTVGTLHQTYRTKYICQSIQEFSQLHSSHIGFEIEDQNLRNNYEEKISKIFSALEDIKQEHHNTQSRMRVIRDNLFQLESFAQSINQSSFRSKNSYESRTLTEEMFPNQQLYKKALKYYYGMWDKLCQKTQSSWNKELVDRIWNVCEQIWASINLLIPHLNYEISTEIDDQTENLMILYQKYFAEQSLPEMNNQLFKQELERVQYFLKNKQAEFMHKLSQKYTMIENPESLVSLMKFGYLVACVVLNLERNGLCVKDQQENENNSQNQQVGDGMGIGEGEAHEGAQNIGDQIEFEEQVLGNKNEQKNEEANANKKEEQDIEMEEDFQGDMYSKQEENQDDQGQQKEADEQMGEVDKKNREEDMKNEQGNAQGKQQEDIEIEGQQKGESELVDNEQHDKQTRKNQNKKEQEGSEQEEEDEKSDWDDNNQQGDKINKREEGEEAQEQSDEDLAEQRNNQELESISGEQNNDNEGQQEEEKKDNKQEGIEEEEIDGQQNNEKQQKVNELQLEEEPQEQENQSEEKQTINKTRRTTIEAYGRSDLNSNNPLKNNQENIENHNDNQEGGMEEQAQGNENDKGGKSNKTVHSLSVELMNEISNLQRKIGDKDNYMKDLNVVEHQENGQQRGNQEQYELTQQEHKVTTNLAALLDNNEAKQEDKKGQADNQRKQQEKRQKQDKQEEQNDEQKKSKQGKDKKQKVNDKNQKPSEKVEDNIGTSDNPHQHRSAKDKNTQPGKPDTKQIIIESNQELYLRKIVQSNQKPELIQIQQNDEQKHEALDEAYEVSKILEEQLKSVLEPLDISEYSGDFKTGKKLNLRKIIPFIASNYRKDRIWLRRTEPSQRNYHIMLALDDTKSMLYGDVGNQALKGLLAISMALQNLNIKTCITGIRETMHIFKQFEQLMEINHVANQFSFQFESKVSHDLSIASFVEASLKQFALHESADSGVENKQLCLIISDGKMNKEYVRPYLKDAKKKDIIYVFIIIDSQSNSILTTKSATIDDNGKISMKLYLNDFPFEYFLIVRNVREIGQILAMTLMQFIQQK